VWYAAAHNVLIQSGITKEGMPVVIAKIEGEMPVKVISRVHGVSSAGNNIFGINGGVVLLRLLESYGVLGNKHFPMDLLRESVEVREALLAGVIDGDGHYEKERRMYELCAKELAFMKGAVHLCRALGCTTGKVAKRVIKDKETGKEYDGYRIHIGGPHLNRLQTVLLYKRASAPSENARDQLCHSFRITKLPHAPYYGFALDGNQKCLTAGCIVTHNSRVLCH
jgi:hypothetical protein